MLTLFLMRGFAPNTCSLQDGSLQLLQVAASDGGAARTGHRLVLGEDRAGASLRDQEAWLIAQPAIALPDSGGLVLPLSHAGFLVGLLTVERGGGLEAAAGGGAAAAAGASGTGSAAGAAEQQWQHQQHQQPASAHPPACVLFGPRELSLLRAAAQVLSAACAMELRAAIERAAAGSAALRQAAARELVQEARAPLSTLRTLGAMLKGRLPKGEPDREMAEGIIEQARRCRVSKVYRPRVFMSLTLPLLCSSLLWQSCALTSLHANPSATDLLCLCRAGPAAGRGGGCSAGSAAPARPRRGCGGRAARGSWRRAAGRQLVREPGAGPSRRGRGGGSHMAGRRWQPCLCPCAAQPVHWLRLCAAGVG